MKIATTPAPKPAPAAAAAPTELPPANKVFKGYARDMLQMPGSIYTGWSIKAPNSVHLVFEAPEFEDMARAILRPSIDGISVDLRTAPKPESGTRDARSGASRVSPKGRDNWQFSLSNMQRAVSGLPGVYDYSAGNASLTFYTVNQASADHLKTMVRNTFGGYDVSFVPMKHPA